jgi:hypothetical protein
MMIVHCSKSWHYRKPAVISALSEAFMRARIKNALTDDMEHSDRDERPFMESCVNAKSRRRNLILCLVSE